MFLHQTFDPADLGTVGLLVLLEGSLSLDNALILGLMAGRLPPRQARQALAIGLIAAFVFRLAAVLLATYLLYLPAIQLAGAAYLVYLSIRHFFFSRRTKSSPDSRARGFWVTMLSIELTDLAFAVDNILAAVALVGPPPVGSPAGRLHPKLWVVFTGGMLGLVLTRAAAVAGIGLLRRFPRLVDSAYLILMIVAAKLIVQWKFGPQAPDFQSVSSPAFWAFWSILAACLVVGIIRPAD
jgi:YkoY family integral membrane protein